MKNKRFLCYQLLVNKEIKGNTNIIDIDVIIRNVGAETKEEALGKFILKINEMKATQKLDPVCFELDDLKCID